MRPCVMTRLQTLIWVCTMLLLSLVMTSSAVANGYSFTNRCGIDSWVDESNPTANSGATYHLLYLTNSGTDYPSGGSGWTLCPVFQWHLDMGEGESIQSVSSATFTFETAWGIPDGTTIRFYRLTAPFDEETVCWNNRPTRDESTYVEWTYPGDFNQATIDLAPLLACNGSLHTFGIEASAAPGTTGWAGGFVCYSKDDSYWGTRTGLSASYIAHGQDELALTGNVRRGQNLPVSFTCTPNLPALFDGISNDNGLGSDTTLNCVFAAPVVVSRVKVIYYNDSSYNGFQDVSGTLLSGGISVATSNIMPAIVSSTSNEIADTQGYLRLGNEADCYFTSAPSADTLSLVIRKKAGFTQSDILEIEVWGLPSSLSTGQGTSYISDFTVTCNTPGSFKAAWDTPPSGTAFMRVRYRVSGTTDWSRVCFGPASTNGIVMGLIPGTTYDVAVDAVGSVSGGTSTVNTVYLTGPTEVCTVADTFGMNFYLHQGNHPDDTLNTLSMLDMMKNAGVRHVRYWGGSGGLAEFLAEWGMTILSPIEADPYGCKDGGIWMSHYANEPDYTDTTANQYATLFAPLYTAMRRVDPRLVYAIPTLGGCLYGPGSSYIDQLYNLLTSTGFDAVDIHPYCKLSGKAPVGGTVPCPETLIGGLASLSSVMSSHNDSGKPIVVSEIGNTTNPGNTFLGQCTQVQQAQWLIREMLLLIANDVKRIYLYAFQDASTDSSDSESGFGMVDWYGTPKLAYSAYSYMTGLIGPTIPNGTQSGVSSPVYGVRFKKSNNTYITVLWDCGGTSNLICNWSGAGVSSIKDLYGNSVSIPGQGQPLILSESVVYVSSANPLTVSSQSRISPAIAPQMQMTLSPSIVPASPSSNATITATVWHNFSTSQQVQVYMSSPFTDGIIQSSIYTVQPNTQANIPITVSVPSDAITKLWSWDARCQYRANSQQAWSGPVYRAFFLQVGARPQIIPISEAKKCADYTIVSLHDTVSAVSKDFFYIESVDRTSGIRVEKTDHGFCDGQSVYAYGIMTTLSSGERCVVATDATSDNVAQ